VFERVSTVSQYTNNSPAEFLGVDKLVESRTLLYSDFNCPFCYALHERLHEENVLTRCEWRGVQHASQLPRPMKPWQGMLGAELRHEVTVVQRLAPGLPIALPPGKPNTKPAIEQAVALLQRDRSQGMVFVRETYRAFWCDGKDISDPDVLRRLVEQAGGSTEGMDSTGAASRQVAQEWESAWHRTGQAGVPLLVSPEGDVLVGCVSSDQIRQFFA
jgi:predicted DsbA family dithiol-disulfide isomerase